jgi:hypothetical protein
MSHTAMKKVKKLIYVLVLVCNVSPALCSTIFVHKCFFCEMRKQVTVCHETSVDD